MARFELDTVLSVQLGAAERDWHARIIYQGGRWQANIERIELHDPVTGEWYAVPWLIEAIEDSAPLYDELRAYAAGRITDACEAAAAVRREPV